jgi:hypothetical protein
MVNAVNPARPPSCKDSTVTIIIFSMFMGRLEENFEPSSTHADAAAKRIVSKPAAALCGRMKVRRGTLSG